jgi:hypothetical protein
MLNSDRFIIATAFGCLAFAFLALDDAHYRENQATAADNHSQRVEQIETARAGIPFAAERFASNPEPKNPDEREKRDLAAQEASAAWAFWVALFAGFQIIATIIGLYYIKRTLDATLTAVEDAGKATKAMNKANEIALASQRAWLHIERVEVKLSAHENKEKIAFHAHARITVKNAGKIPAVAIERNQSLSAIYGTPTAQNIYGDLTRAGGFRVPSIPPNSALTIKIFDGFEIDKGQFEVMCGICVLDISFVYNDGVAEERRHSAQSYRLCKKVGPNGALDSFSKEDLFSMEPINDDWTTGSNCELWPAQEGIIT